MKNLLLIVVLLVTSFSVKAKDDVKASSFYGVYRGKMKVNIEGSSSSTVRDVVFTISKGSEVDESSVKVTLSGYQIGGYELKDFDILGGTKVQKVRGMWMLTQDVTAYVQVESKNKGKVLFMLGQRLEGDFVSNDELKISGAFHYGDLPNMTQMNFDFSGKRDKSTGISGVKVGANDKEDRIFDLQGRRVYAPQKGLYIINGKKVLKY